MSDKSEIRELHAGLEALAAEVARLRQRLDDRDLDQAVRDDALNRALSSEPEEKRPPWKLLCGGADVAAAGAALVQKAVLVAVTGAVQGALTILGRKELKGPRAAGGEAPCALHGGLVLPQPGKGSPQRERSLPPAWLNHQTGYARRAGESFL